MAWPLVAYSTQPPSADRYRVDYIFYFTKYVEWPVSWMGDDTSPITICVISEPEFQDFMSARLRDRVSQGHPVHVVRGDNDKANCHITYVQGRDFTRVRTSSTILISDSNGRRADDSSIILHERNGKIAFEVNLYNLSRSGVKVSSEFLKLARVKR